MYIKDITEEKTFYAGDGSLLVELLHPDKADLKIRYSLAHAVVRPGQITDPHRLSTSEVYYILEGDGIMHINEETAEIKTGQAIYIPPRSLQYIQNSGTCDLKFICIVDPAWRAEDEEILSNQFKIP